MTGEREEMLARVAQMPPHYVITHADDVCCGPCVGTVTDALTGRVTATFKDGSRLVIGEPLCMATDKPLIDCCCEVCGEKK